MSRDLFSLFAGTTIRELRHFRDVPRASTPITARRAARKLPLHEIEAAISSAYART